MASAVSLNFHSNYMKSFLSMAIVALLLTACSNSSKKAGDNVQDAPKMAGSDRDKHGCIPSAGYQWSEIRNSCIRLFEDGIRLDPKAAGLDQTLSAFAVFKSPLEDAQAEIFMPREANSIMLNKSAAGVWKNKFYTLKSVAGGYSLEDTSGKLLYQNMGN
jgi:hypothetical protein